MGRWTVFVQRCARLLFACHCFSRAPRTHRTRPTRRPTRRAICPRRDLSAADAQADADRFLAAPGFACATVANNPAAPGATPVGEKTCIACHQLESEHFTHTLHALGLHAAAKADPSIPVCETCHGPGFGACARTADRRA